MPGDDALASGASGLRGPSDGEGPLVNQQVGYRQISVPFGEMRVRTWGDPSLPALLLLHGLGSTNRIWDLCIPFLSDSYYLVAPDQRGHGGSSKPADGYGWTEVTDDAVRLLDGLGLERAYVMGHSWGGDVTLELAVRHPGRVEAICLVDGGIIDFRAHMEWPEARRLLEPKKVCGFTLEELKAAIEPWLRSLPAREQHEIILANYEVRSDGTVCPHLPYDANMAIARAMWEHRPPRLYEQLTRPALVLQAVPPGPLTDMSQRFHRWRSECVELAQNGPARATVRRFVDTVHDVPLQCPRELVSAWEEFRVGL